MEEPTYFQRHIMAGILMERVYEEIKLALIPYDNKIRAIYDNSGFMKITPEDELIVESLMECRREIIKNIDKKYGITRQIELESFISWHSPNYRIGV